MPKALTVQERIDRARAEIETARQAEQGGGPVHAVTNRRRMALRRASRELTLLNMNTRLGRSATLDERSQIAASSAAIDAEGS